MKKRVMLMLTFVVISTSVFSLPKIADGSESLSASTVSQELNAVRKSISISTISPSVAHMLELYAGPSSYRLKGASTFGSCDAWNSPKFAKSPKPCLFGNLHGRETIVLIGDSNVGNWIPALNAGLKRSRYRLAVFGFSSCGLADLPYTPSWGVMYSRCRQWHKSIPRAVRSLHPVAILGASGPVGTEFSGVAWADGVRKLFDELTVGSPKTKRIILGTTPLLPQSAVTCLTIHASPEDCALHYRESDSFYGSLLSRDKLVARLSHATLLNTSRFFCFNLTCSPVIDNLVVYSDDNHVTISYSSFISEGVTDLLLTALK